MCRLLSIGFVASLIFASHARAGDKLPAEADVRKAITRALPFVEKDGLAWINKRDCMSCHVVTFMLWAHNEALAHGIAVDQKKLAEWTKWSMDKSLGSRVFYKLSDKSVKALPESLRPTLAKLVDEGFTHEPEFVAALAKTLTADELKQHRAAIINGAKVGSKGGVNDGGSLEAMAQLFLARGPDAKDHAAFYASTAEFMMRTQQPGGLWKAGGQLPSRRWSPPTADQTTTMWTILALAGYDDAPPAIQKSVEKAHAAVKKPQGDGNLEWLVARALYEHKFGSPKQATTVKSQLMNRQNADGGWSALPKGKSEAFSTGQSLYALSVGGLGPIDPVIRRGQKYLLDTQTPDGFWVLDPVLTSKGGPPRLKKLTPIYRNWGTSWAVIGLAKSLPEAGEKKQAGKAMPTLAEAFTAWHKGFASKKKEDRENALRSMLLNKKDVEYLFPKHAEKLWPLWSIGNDFMLKNVEKIAQEVTRSGAILKIDAIDVRKEKRQLQRYREILEIIPKTVPVFDISVRYEKGAGGGGAYLYVHDRWVWVKDLEAFPKVLNLK